MKGEPDRKVFSALSPMTEGLSRIKRMPYVIADQPTLTFVARQRGEAWNRPFVSVFEPHTAQRAPSRIKSVSFPQVSADKVGSHAGIRVEQTDGAIDRILSSDQAEAHCQVETLSACASYALGREKAGEVTMAFMGGGTFLETGDVCIQSEESADVLLVKDADGWHYTASSPCKVTIGGKSSHLSITQTKMPVFVFYRRRETGLQELPPTSCHYDYLQLLF